MSKVSDASIAQAFREVRADTSLHLEQWEFCEYIDLRASELSIQAAQPEAAAQPIAEGVTDAMVERAMRALVRSRGTYAGEVQVDPDDIRAALTAALAATPAAPKRGKL